MEEGAAEDDRADRVQAVLERGDDAEIAAAAAQPPEEVVVLDGARRDEASVGGDHVGREEVVAGQAVLSHQPTDPAAEGEARDPGARDQAAGGGEPERLRVVIELRPHDPAFGSRGAVARIDADALHRREVEDDAAVARAEAGDVVPAGADGDDELVPAGEAEACDHVRRAGAANDEGRPPVDHPVPDRAGGVVGVVAGDDERAADLLCELREVERG